MAADKKYDEIARERKKDNKTPESDANWEFRWRHEREKNEEKGETKEDKRRVDTKVEEGIRLALLGLNPFVTRQEATRNDRATFN